MNFLVFPVCVPTHIIFQIHLFSEIRILKYYNFSLFSPKIDFLAFLKSFFQCSNSCPIDGIHILSYNILFVHICRVLLYVENSDQMDPDIIIYLYKYYHFVL